MSVIPAVSFGGMEIDVENEFGWDFDFLKFVYSYKTLIVWAARWHRVLLYYVYYSNLLTSNALTLVTQGNGFKMINSLNYFMVDLLD